MIKTEIFTLQSHDTNPVVFLHSSMSSGEQWQRLRHQCSNETSCPDLLGYGQSPLPDSPSDSFSIRHEIEALQGRLYQQPFHLVGHSFGAATALQIARRFPEQILSLSLFEPVAFHLLPEAHPALSAIRTVQQTIDSELSAGRPAQAAEFFIDYWNPAGTFQRLSQQTQQQFTISIRKVAMDFSALMNEPSGPEALSSIQCPILLLEGAHSTETAHAVINTLTQTFPDAEKHRLLCGHMGPITHPELVNPLVSQFIATHKKA